MVDPPLGGPVQLFPSMRNERELGVHTIAHDWRVSPGRLGTVPVVVFEQGDEPPVIFDRAGAELMVRALSQFLKDSAREDWDPLAPLRGA
jgi:hypothetical protein